MKNEAKIVKYEPKTFYATHVKRWMDVILSFIAIIILIPILLVVGLLIKLDSPGSVIYKQKRVGKDVKDFHVYKFRTMVSDADKIGPKSTKVGDNRVTKVGKILRKLSIDELPQLLNVFLGNMSLVGYRPGVRENYKKEDLESAIFNVKPGITGYAQINGRSKLSVEEKREWEIKYIEDISFKTDIKIILLTIKKVLTGESAF